MTLFFILLIFLTLYAIMLFNKQKFIESYKNHCSLNKVGLPNNHFNQLFFLDKKIDILEKSIKGINSGDKNLKQLDNIYNKYDWMKKHYDAISNPNSKARKDANKKAEKEMQNKIANRDKLARDAFNKKHKASFYKNGPPVIGIESGSPEDRQNLRKLKQNPNKKKNKIFKKVNNSAEDDDEKAQVKDVMSDNDPPKGMPSGSARVSSGPDIPNGLFGGAFA